jgi:hypothetical protein
MVKEAVVVYLIVQSVQSTSEVLMALPMQITVFQEVTPCSVQDG